MSLTRRNALGLLGGSALSLAAGPSLAQQGYPDRVVKLMVPFPAGGASDVIARLSAQEMTPLMGQSVIVENKGGANGIIGVETVLQAPADGYYLLAAGGSAWTQSQVKDLRFDMMRDFDPVVPVTSTPMGLIVNPNVPANTAEEFFAYARKNPGKLNYASVAPNDLLWTELLKFRTGTDIQSIAYRGNAPALTALLGNEVQMTLTSIAAFLPHVREGKLKLLAVTTEKRSPIVPEIPTLLEAGVKDFVSASNNGTWVKKGTAPEIIRKINEVYNAFLARPEVQKSFLEKIGAVTLGGTPEDLRTMIANDHRRLDEAARVANYTPA